MVCRQRSQTSSCQTLRLLVSREISCNIAPSKLAKVACLPPPATMISSKISNLSNQAPTHSDFSCYRVITGDTSLVVSPSRDEEISPIFPVSDARELINSIVIQRDFDEEQALTPVDADVSNKVKTGTVYQKPPVRKSSQSKQSRRLRNPQKRFAQVQAGYNCLSSNRKKEPQSQDISEEAVDQILAESHSVSKKLSNGLSIVNENSISNDDSMSALHATAHHKLSDFADQHLSMSRPASLMISRKTSQNKP